jgi:hypothetical protein
MPWSQNLPKRLLQVSGIMALFLTGCNAISTQGSTNTCAANTASIYVYGGGMQINCGCVEASGSTFGVGQTLQCTIPVGTQVYFYYSNVSDHQLSIVGAQQAYPPHGPDSQNPNANGVDIYNANSTGNVSFIDTVTNFNGIFHVTP